MGYLNIFKWLLCASFFTDLIDGVLSRKLKVTSVFGSRLDSMGDDLSFLAGLIGAFVFKLDFIIANLITISIVFGLFLFQTIFALIRYGRLTSFHVYFAKLAALFQGTFLILLFLLPEPLYFLFYAAVITTAMGLIEEIIIIYYLPVWEANVKGLYWVLKNRKK